MFKKLFCKHIFVEKKVIHRDIGQKEILGYVTERYIRYVVREECVKCGKERIVERDVPISKY